MASTTFQVSDGSAASLLHYQAYTKPGTTEKNWTRFASADEEFNLTAAKGRKFLIKFDKNFSKKHLATFSKKDKKLQEKVQEIAKRPGQAGKDAENLKLAQEELLKAKILKTLGIRSGTSDEVKCQLCGHPKKNNPVGTGHSQSGRCQVTGCTCAGYVSSYTTGRTAQGKPVSDPYAGASASQSSCIVLNLIPKNQFEDAVSKAILAIDPDNKLAPTATTGSPAPLEHLKLDFGLANKGAVRKAENGAISLADGTWCEVGAQKATSSTPGIDAIWTIVHWEGQG